MSLGERFRAAREERGLSLSDVAEQIRIRSVYLAAIEEENWSAIGAPVYIRGFIRTYARFLGLDSAEAVSRFNDEMGGPVAGAQTAPAGSRAGGIAIAPSENRGLSPLIWIASLVALALIAFVVYLYFSPPKGGGPTMAGGAVATQAPGVPAAGETSAPGSQAASPSPAASPTPLVSKETLAIHLTDASWLRVTVDGNVRVEGTFPAGTNKSFHGKAALLRVGNAGGVEVTVDGKPLGKLGATGDVVEKSYTL